MRRPPPLHEPIDGKTKITQVAWIKWLMELVISQSQPESSIPIAQSSLGGEDGPGDSVIPIASTLDFIPSSSTIDPAREIGDMDAKAMLHSTRVSDSTRDPRDDMTRIAMLHA